MQLIFNNYAKNQLRIEKLRTTKATAGQQTYLKVKHFDET